MSRLLEERGEEPCYDLRLLFLHKVAAVLNPDQPEVRGFSELTMSEAIGKLLSRNLQEVFGEHHGDRRRIAIAQIYTEDCIFEDHFGQNVGHAAIDAAVEKLQEKFPAFVFSEAGPVQRLQIAARLPRHFGPPEEPGRIGGWTSLLCVAIELRHSMCFWTNHGHSRHRTADRFVKHRSRIIVFAAPETHPTCCQLGGVHSAEA